MSSRFFLILLFLFTFIPQSYAGIAKDYTAALAPIPVLHDGRLKPMDSFARAHLKQLSGTDKQAIMWLTEALFDPAQGEQRHVLKINSPALLNTLALEKRASKKYSYREVYEALNKKQDMILSILGTPEDQWSMEQKNLIQLQRNTVLLGDIFSSLSLFLPLAINISEDAPEMLQPFVDKAPLAYINFLGIQKDLEDKVKTIIENKGLDPASYSAAEQQLTLLSFTLANLRNVGARSRILKVIPDPTDTGNYLSPWEIVSHGKSHPALKDEFKLWQDLVLGYHQNNPEAFVQIAQKISAQNSSSRLNLELLYNHLAPFKLSFALYVIALCAMTAGTLLWPGKEGLFTKASIIALSGGALLHIIGIGVRMYILARPPVSTLYESILFVGAVSVLYALFAYTKDKKNLWLWLAAGCGAVLQLLGFAHNQDGDSMLMLTAVLNTNFWLATHVTCITAGYAFCLIASILAHYILTHAAFNKTTEVPKSLFKRLWTTGLIALLFTAVGTVLGGIWADQSWGRFWGWDPKENGALLIVLWLIWVIHGKIARQFNEFWAAAGLAYLSVIVALSWFGVNLLSVGLHAYGFTDSAAWTLGLFTCAETMFIGTLICLIYKKEGKHAA